MFYSLPSKLISVLIEIVRDVQTKKPINPILLPVSQLLTTSKYLLSG